MDWKYILSLTFENLSDDKKDELFNTVTWFNMDDEEVSNRKLTALFKLSQDILKYKGEQVETLVHELDELATKQGEEESKRLESDNEGTLRSSRSRKSSSIDYENLEQKLIEIKSKYKKQLKLNERNTTEIDKLNNKIQQLEQENKRLHNEIQSKSRDGSESDVSETMKDQHREAVEALQNKNKQISDLLHDIEEVEHENLILRDKLAKIKDELANATNEITITTERLTSSDLRLEESLEAHKLLQTRMEDLQEEFHSVQEEKRKLEEELGDFTKEINLRIDEWKKILAQKDAEIHKLQSSIHIETPSIHSSLSSLPNDDEKSNINVLNKILKEREKQLLEVQARLQQAIKEMEESTSIIEKLKQDKESNKDKIKQLTENLADVKKQLKIAHQRSYDLQEELIFIEKTAANKDDDLKEILQKLENSGNIDLSNYCNQIQELKAKTRTQERHIMNLVKSSNKLQETNDQLEKINNFLRNKLGLSEDDSVDLGSSSVKQKKQKRDIDKIRKTLLQSEEENLELRSEVQKLTRTVASMSDQLIDLGYKPKEKYFGKSGKITNFEEFRTELKGLAEENEALRKGMHEILNTLNIRKEKSLNEIKSETFEKLLRALDVKHISGWYHPAMRLQAELHNLEGINAELREQLRLAKLKIKEEHQVVVKSPKEVKIPEKVENELEQSGTDEVDKIELDNIVIEENCNIENIAEDLENIMKELPEDVTITKFLILKKKIDFVCLKQSNDKQMWEENLQRKNNEVEELNEKNQITEEKLKILTENQTDKDIITKIEEMVVSKIKQERKIKYLKDEVDKNVKDNEYLKSVFRSTEMELKKEINDLIKRNNSLLNKLKISENFNELSVDATKYKETQKNLENLTINYRNLIEDMKEKTEQTSQQISLLQETEKLLENENQELKTKLINVLGKLHYSENNGQPTEDNIQILTKKLSECEVSEISERQRANHINNLYELVKEQLQKSDDRFREFSKYNEDILHKNLVLQEQLKEAENKLLEFVDVKVYQQLQNVNTNLLKENENLQLLLGNLEEKLQSSEESSVQYLWNTTKEQELLNLKHQIVDLIANSDDKMQISILHSDLMNSRKLENECKIKLVLLEKEFEKNKINFNTATEKYEQEKMLKDEKLLELEKKNGIMRDLLIKQKLQYLGSIPLCLEEKYISKLKELNVEKHEIFLQLHKTKILEKETEILKEQCELEMKSVLKQKQLLSGDKDEFKNVFNWIQEKKNLQLSELRYRRQSEYKEAQLNHFIQRIAIQDEQIGKLEEELLLWHKNYDLENTKTKVDVNETLPKPNNMLVILTKSEEVQTDEFVNDVNSEEGHTTNLKIELINVQENLKMKENTLEQQRNKITELEMTVNMFKKQIGDKQSQITFYERHILELQQQNRKDDTLVSGPDGDNITVGNGGSDETLKSTINRLQETLAKKEEEIIEYQSLLKTDRDKHSLAAERLQEELKSLQTALADEKQKHSELQEFFNQSRPTTSTIDQYISQVHVLEKHIAELHTNVTSLEAQLQSSRQEAVRWRELANHRLQAMDNLKDSLEDQHKNEIDVYRNDSEKWRTEVKNLKELISKYQNESNNFGEDITSLLKEKDKRIQELTLLTKSERKKIITDNSDSESSLKLSELEAERQMLLRENKTLKKRYEQILQKEYNSREEIRELKAQLLKKQAVLYRSDKSDKSIKEQLQKKVTVLESENVVLKEKLSEQISINDCHKIKITDDFDRWKKQKYWQQSIEKLKNKLKEREVELEKLQSTSSGHRLLIERLEREKHNLENRVKSLKRTNIGGSNWNDLEILKIDNARLLSEVEMLTSKLEMQQQGGVGTAFLQDKLEMQERKIAMLELSSRGSAEVRTELDRLQTSISTLQKRNLCLEAENLDLKLDLEKSNNEMPHLKEQILHLENYIEVLKSENLKQSNTSEPDVKLHAVTNESKKVSELERTIFVLKRVVEKLQIENKRLLSGKRVRADRPASIEKIKKENERLKEQYAECLKKVAQIEQNLTTNSNKNKKVEVASITDDNVKLKQELEHKSQLLDKVKVLLHRAASKEKSLLQEIAALKEQNLLTEMSGGEDVTD